MLPQAGTGMNVRVAAQPRRGPWEPAWPWAAGPPPRRRRAFSLAELMIALALLGMGLLVIGGALPIGARYLEESANLATGEAAVNYGLDLMEQSLLLRRAVLDPDNPNADRPRWETGIFRPRNVLNGLPAKDPRFQEKDWEPVIKVRPLPVGYALVPGPNLPQQWQNWPEAQIASWLGSQFHVNDPWKETCPAAGDAAFVRPPLPMSAMVYPPPAGEGGWSRPRDFQQNPYAVPQGCDPTVWARQLALRRVTWVGFYRRVAYEQTSDPQLYELIVFAVRRPSDAHRFPGQTVGGGLLIVAGSSGEKAGDSAWAGGIAADVGAAGEVIARDSVGATGSGGATIGTGDDGVGAEKGGTHTDSGTMGGGTTLAGSYGNVDAVVPVPWLVTFTALPQPSGGFDSEGYYQDNSPALTFRIDASISGLFPVGTLFLPARNDDNPGLLSSGAQSYPTVGFGPPAPTALPLYKVVGRPDDTTVLVENNGFFPRRGENQTPLPGQWPVWVIPPAFAEKSGNVPIFDGKSAILSVGRRYVRLREVP